MSSPEPSPYRHIVDHLNRQQSAQALALLAPMLAAAPDCAESWDYQLAACTMAGLHEEAEQAFVRCQQLGVVFPETLINAAHNAQRWGRPERLQYYAEQLLESGQAQHQLQGQRFLVDALWRQQRYPESLQACQQLLALQPEDLRATRLLIKNLTRLDRPSEALTYANRALVQWPDDAQLLVLRIEAMTQIGAIPEALAAANQWIESHPSDLDPQILSTVCFFSQFDQTLTIAERRRRAERFGDFARRHASPYQSWLCLPDPEQSLHVALLSGDMRNHPMGYFLEPLIREWQHRAITVTVYDTLDDHDSQTAKIRPLVDHWHSITKLTNQQAAELIHSHRVDILIDLHGHTTGQRLGVMAFKPAPVQVTWMGFQSTTGMTEVDYVLVDPRCVPPGCEQEFTEQVWRLPYTFCFMPIDLPIAVGPPPAEQNGFVTFGCLNKPNKINDSVLALWAKVLAATPHSRLLLKGKGFDIGDYREQFVRRLLLAGIDPDRVDLEGPCGRAEFLAAYQRIDIALDPFPYSGATTTVEALWCGVPVLAIAGDCMVWRMANSILTQAGHPEWLAEDAEQFVQLATNMASDIEALSSQRAVQQQQIGRSELFDSSRYADNLDRALRGMWQAYLSAGAAEQKPTNA